MNMAIVMRRTGGPDVLDYVEVPLPTPGEGEVLVRTRATGVNFIDVYHRTGLYPVSLPATLGLEGSGDVVAVGSGVTTWQVGDRVATVGARGSYAEHFLADASSLVRVPNDVSDECAAALLLQGITAHYLCRSVFEVGPQHTVLIHAGAGGVGLLLTQLVKNLGARVFTTVSTPDKAELSRQAGSDEVLSYEGFAEQTRALTGGEGVDVVFDGVGASTFEGSLRATGVRGMVALFGSSSGPVPPFDLARLNGLGSLVVTRPTLGHFIRTPEELAWRTDELFAGVLNGTLTVRIGGTYPLADAGRAHTDLASRSTTGKLLLIP
jgi:NADPH2:quinone reductase